METINRSLLFTYLNKHHTPTKMVVAGVGVEHGKLVEAVEKYFVQESTIWSNDSALGMSKVIPVDNSVAQYTGGLAKVGIFEYTLVLVKSYFYFELDRKNVIFLNLRQQVYQYYHI